MRKSSVRREARGPRRVPSRSLFGGFDSEHGTGVGIASGVAIGHEDSPGTSRHLLSIDFAERFDAHQRARTGLPLSIARQQIQETVGTLPDIAEPQPLLGGHDPFPFIGPLPLHDDPLALRSCPSVPHCTYRYRDAHC